MSSTRLHVRCESCPCPLAALDTIMARPCRVHQRTHLATHITITHSHTHRHTHKHMACTHMPPMLPSASSTTSSAKAPRPACKLPNDRSSPNSTSEWRSKRWMRANMLNYQSRRATALVNGWLNRTLGKLLYLILNGRVAGCLLFVRPSACTCMCVLQLDVKNSKLFNVSYNS